MFGNKSLYPPQAPWIRRKDSGRYCNNNPHPAHLSPREPDQEVVSVSQQHRTAGQRIPNMPGLRILHEVARLNVREVDSQPKLTFGSDRIRLAHLSARDNKVRISTSLPHLPKQGHESLPHEAMFSSGTTYNKALKINGTSPIPLWFPQCSIGYGMSPSMMVLNTNMANQRLIGRRCNTILPSQGMKNILPYPQGHHERCG